jgi:hypothetical protein
MRGLDPRIHHLRKKLFFKVMDCRVKPGNDSHYLETCADTANQRPFCRAQQSV